MSEPKISIVTVVLNAQKSLERTIASVGQQSYENIEFIVVDGQSTDGTAELVRSSSTITKSIIEKDRGLFFAMNKGKALASGDFAFFLNAGDEFCSPNVIQSVVANMDHPDRNYFGNVVINNGCFSWRIGYNRLLESENFDKRSLTIHHQSIFFPAKFYKTNDYDTTFLLIAESDYISRAIIDADVKFIPLDILHSKLEGLGISRFKTLAGTSAYCSELKSLITKNASFYNVKKCRSRIAIKSYGKYILYKLGGLRLLTTVVGLRATLYNRLGLRMIN